MELRLSPLPEAVLLPALRERFPDVPEGTLRAAGVRAGGYLGRAESILRDDAGLLPQSAAFVRAYCARRPEELLQVLAPMERLKREQLRPILTQWQALLVSALTSRSGLPPLRPECAQIAEARPVSDITQAIEAIRLGGQCQPRCDLRRADRKAAVNAVFADCQKPAGPKALEGLF